MRRIELRQHFDLELLFNGRRVAYGAKVEAKLVRLIGLTVAQLQRAFERAHPTIHRDTDPMGDPWQLRISAPT